MALSDKLIQISNLKVLLDELMPMKLEDEKRLWEKIRIDWNYNSNSIEGNTLTYSETRLLLMFEESSGDHPKRELDEMEAHDVAIHMVREWSKDKVRELSESDIRELNKIILVQPYWKNAITPDNQPSRRQIKIGEYKEHPNSVRLPNGEIFEFSSPLETPQKMAELMNWYRSNDVDHPSLIASQLHYKFIRIHPFDDGNGRVARLIVNYTLMKEDYPPLIIKSDEKDKYLTALHKADSGDIAAFDEYMADQLIWSLQLAIDAAEGNEITEPGDIDKELKQIELKLKNNQAEVIKRNDQLVTNVFEKSIRPLAEATYQKLIKFNSLFAEFEVVIYKESAGQVAATKEKYDQLLSDAFVTRNIHRVRIDYRWNGFNRAGTHIFNAFAALQIELGDFEYIINKEAQPLNEQKCLYSQQLSQTEINKIVDDMANKVLAAIKQQYKQLTGKEL